MVRSTLRAALIIAGITAGGVHADLAEQRAAFGDALRAAKRGDVAAVDTHREALAGYTLAPYLDYYLLGNTFDRAAPGAVREFIARWPDLPVNERLRRDWLRALAHHGRWEAFLQDWHDPVDTPLRCHWVTAQIQTGGADAPAVAARATELWLVGRSQPDACDPVFAWLEASGQLTPALIHQRMALALEARQYSLAGWLARRLDDADRDFVQRWRAMQQSPARALAAGALPADSADERRLLVAGLERLARIEPAAARTQLQRLDAHFRFDPADRTRVLRMAGLIAAQRHAPEASAWLAAVDEADFMVDEWRVRAALRHRDWDGVRNAIAQLPDTVRDQDGWRYWDARAAEQVGDSNGSRDAYEAIATGHGYHAWLAADRLDRPYAIQGELTAADEPMIDAIAERLPVQRAREFLALGMLPEARAEWAGAIRGMSVDELVQAALLAERWQWHAQAIATLGRAGRYEDLALRYPVLFQRQIAANARDNGVDAALVYSLVRSESLFMPDARSGAGALGLMQLMPGTGREVARRIGMQLPSNSALLDPDTNVKLGSAYLGSVLSRFGQHEVLATAAYNAGPHRVQRWLPHTDALPADIWVETIPFNETRGYVRQVMAGAAIFDWRLGQEVRPLSSRMRDVPAVAE